MKLRNQSKKELLMFPPANILSLPEEILVHIFSYLSLGELTSTVPKVCKQWERLHWDRALYHVPRIDLIEGKVTAKKVLTSLQVAPCLRSTYFEDGCIRKAINTCIRKINKIRYQENPSETGKHQVINVCYRDVVSILSHLQAMHFHHMSSKDHPKALAHLVSHCCVQLKELKAYDNSFPLLMNADVISLCGRLRDTLRVLYLDCADWTLDCIIAITKCRQLQDLNICDGHELTSESLLAIAKMSNLRHLRIYSCYLPTINEWLSFFSNRALNKLTTLHIASGTINDKVLVTIGANLRNLIELYLVARLFEITSRGLKSIIMGCSKLTSIKIQVSDDRDEAIGNVMLMIPEYLPGLEDLEVLPRSANAPKWEVALKSKMPHLRVR